MKLEIELKAQKPFDGRSLLEFLGRRAIAGVEAVSETGYRRTVALESGSGLLTVTVPTGKVGTLRVEAELPHARWFDSTIDGVRRIFDLAVDPRRVVAVLRRDSLLEETVRAHPGLRVPGCWDGFELAVRAILGQQVTVRGATTLGARLVRAYGQRLGEDGELSHLFPEAKALCEASLDEVGLPRARAETIRGLARAVTEGRLVLDPGGDSLEVRRAMTAIRGIGDWTAQYVAMRALRDPDAFPSGDLVLRQVAAKGSILPSARELEARSQSWRPWRAYAAIHLWKRSAGVSQADETPRVAGP